MSQRKDSYSLYKCETCGNQISGITKLQQNNPSSHLWARYGLCSPGCLAPVSTLRKDRVSAYNKIDPGSFDTNSSQVKGAETKSNSQISPVMYVEAENKKSTPAWKRIIACGRITGGIALANAFVLFYSDIIIGAIASLGFVVIGIALCRIGVWKKCRIRK